MRFEITNSTGALSAAIFSGRAGCFFPQTGQRLRAQRIPLWHFPAGPSRPARAADAARAAGEINKVKKFVTIKGTSSNQYCNAV
jgi:hypothetical protein